MMVAQIQASSWETVEAAELAANVKNAFAMGPFGSRITKDNFIPYGVPVIRGTNIAGDRFSHNDLVYISEEKADELRASVAYPDDLVFTHRGTLGQVGLIPHGHFDRYVVSQSQMKWTCDPSKVVPAFLYYYFRSPFGQHELLSHTGGSGVPAISSPLSTLKSAKVYLPPLPIQRKIAAILSAYDDLIENNTRRIALLEAMAQALYREWFVRFRFPGHEAVPLVDSPLGAIPEGWRVMPVSEAVSIDPKTSVPAEGEKPFVPMANLSNHSMLITDIERRTGNSGSKFRNGDTLLARITPCLENGKTGYVRFLPSADAVAFGSTEFIVLRAKATCPEFVYLLARTDELRNSAIKSMTGATGRQRVQAACFDQMLIAHPDAAINERFQQLVAPLFQGVHTLAERNANLRQTRDLLLPRLVSGTVDVAGMEVAMGEDVGGIPVSEPPVL